MSTTEKFVITCVPSCLLEEGLAHGWLLSDVVGSHYTNAMKQTQTVDLPVFRLIIVVVSLIACSY